VDNTNDLLDIDYEWIAGRRAAGRLAGQLRAAPTPPAARSRSEPASPSACATRRDPATRGRGPRRLDTSAAEGDDGLSEHAATHAPGGSDDISGYYRAIDNKDFTGLGQALFDSVRATGPFITQDGFQAWNDPDFDLYPVIQFGSGLSRVYFADESGNVAPDVAVGRSGAGVFSAILGLIRANELGGASKDSAYHLARANHTGTQGWATVDKTSSSLADLATRSASDLSTGLLGTARGGSGADGSSLSANVFLGSPSGGAGAVSYRTLAAADIPSLDAAKITSGTLARARLAAEVAYEDEANVFTATGNKFEQLLRVGSPTPGAGLVVGSQSSVLDAGGLTSNVGLTVYVDSSGAASGINYANPNVGVSAGLVHQFLLATDTGVYKRALSTQLDKNNGGSGTAWSNTDATKQNVVYRLRMLKGGSTADSFRIDSVGPNFAFGGNNSYGGGLGVINIANATTVPTSNPTGGPLLYADAGAIKGRGTSGTVSTLAAADPHCPTCGRDFASEYESDVSGRSGYLAICWWCVAEWMESQGMPGIIRKMDYARPERDLSGYFHTFLTEN
jgi:hypothetical protein